MFSYQCNFFPKKNGVWYVGPLWASLLNLESERARKAHASRLACLGVVDDSSTAMLSAKMVMVGWWYRMFMIDDKLGHADDKPFILHVTVFEHAGMR